MQERMKHACKLGPPPPQCTHTSPESLTTQETLTLSIGGGGTDTASIYKAEHSVCLRVGRHFQRQRSHPVAHMGKISLEEEMLLRLVSGDLYTAWVTTSRRKTGGVADIGPRTVERQTAVLGV